jgi:tagatose-1,6-bisphosphate aldolase non-catalytic subunit AgaZ/GatZ
MTPEFAEEYEALSLVAESAIGRILLSEDRISKHPPYTWKDEDVNQHLLKATRHINTYMQIAAGYQKDDGEKHLDNAICRLVMAITKLQMGG